MMMVRATGGPDGMYRPTIAPTTNYGSSQGGSAEESARDATGPSEARPAPAASVATSTPESPSTPRVTMLTITEIAKRMGVGESTIRSWRDRYPDFVLKRRAPDGSGNLYALERFLEIRQLSQQKAPRRSVGEIKAVLAQRYPLEAGPRTREALRFELLGESAPTSTGAPSDEYALAIRDRVDQSLEVGLELRRQLAEGIDLLDRRHGAEQGQLAAVVESQHALIESSARQVAALEALNDLVARSLELREREIEALMYVPDPPRWSLRWWWWRMIGR
jgi:transposase-like protein